MLQPLTCGPELMNRDGQTELPCTEMNGDEVS